MAATMSSELTDTDQLKLFYEDALANGITFLPPDINESDYLFTPDGERHIRYALGAVKGVGEGAVQSIVEARQDGRFRDLFDFCERVGKEHMNKRTLESLIKAARSTASIPTAPYCWPTSTSPSATPNNRRPMPTKAACLTLRKMPSAR